MSASTAEETPAVMTTTSAAAVFQAGKLAVEVIEVDHREARRPPIPILVVSPKDAGTYPVAILLHGFFLRNSFYRGLLTHLASHGFVMVAPQFHINLISTSDTEDIAAAANVTDWLPGGLPSVLPTGVEPDLGKLALAGHSRGGHTAFSLALGHGTTTKLTFSALVGLDPVAGRGKSSRLPPKILTYEASSMDLGGMPVMVVGTGLGEEAKNLFCPPCAPKDVNHKEFYRECRPPCYYLVTKEYGHLDMLEDDAPAMVTCLCKDGGGCKDKMRRTVAGIMVAFLRAALHGEDGDLMAIIKDDPAGLAPTTLDPAHCRLA
ncbi:hypothetical protein E2562_011157 [Oryza meyeriana var. granulata]|uniref:Uncharacterized protein n=1 Tax=Oryza meyeriana var. granulata TaxID=110450 RepID=A0A6G1DGA8_9ORYZ|nr:hypothetical protein E2562_011157 [Oryza meyeriana var. granulata]